MKKTIIIGAPHHNTLGIVRSLGAKGLKPDVYLVSRSKAPGCVKSKFINKIEFFESEESVVDHLLRKNSLGEKSILLLSSDSVSSAIDAKYNVLKNSYVFFNTQGHTTSWMSKEKMCVLATSLGMNVPKYFVYNKGDILPHNITFPCITKAISSIDGGKADTTICRNRVELEEFLSTPNLCPLIQIENYIEKEIEFQFIGVSLNRGETIIIPGHSHIKREKGIQNTYYFPYVENDESFRETLEKTKRFIKSTGYEGLFSVEFIRGKDGIDYFLEMNFRNDGNAHCVTDAGYNLPYIWYLWATGGDYQSEINNSSFKPVKYCPEFYYTLQCAYGEVSFCKWIWDTCTANSFTNYYKGDSPHFWSKFAFFAFKQMVKKVLILCGIKSAPKESIG